MVRTGSGTTSSRKSHPDILRINTLLYNIVYYGLKVIAAASTYAYIYIYNYVYRIHTIHIQ